MTRKFKGLGLAFVAVAAMSMVAASGAQATQVHVEHNGNVSFFGTQTAQQHVFTTNAGTVKCTSAVFEATLANSSSQATASELTATPTYTGCQAFGQSATIDMNGCKYTITGAGQTGGKAAVDVTGCTSGKSIEITTAICRMTVKEQTGINHIGFVQSGTKADMTATVTTGITYQADGPLCPNMPTGQQVANGSYVGQASFEAKSDTGSAVATHNGHEYNKLLQTGTAKNIVVTGE